VKKKENNLVITQSYIYLILLLAKEYNIRFLETSAKEALNITLAFQTLALDIMARFDEGETVDVKS